jgi:hypothetical protein
VSGLVALEPRLSSPELSESRDIQDLFERAAMTGTPKSVFLSTIFQLAEVWVLVALTRGALTALRGEVPQLTTVLTSLRAKWRSICIFAVLFGAGRSLPLFTMIEGDLVRRHGALFLWMLFAVGWSFSLYLGIPVLARESASGIAALRRALSLIRAGWRTRLAGLLRIAIYSFPLLMIASFIQVILKNSVSATAWSWIGGVPLILCSAFFLAVDQVFDAALYSQLTEGVPPDPSGVRGDEELIWRARADSSRGNA